MAQNLSDEAETCPMGMPSGIPESAGVFKFCFQVNGVFNLSLSYQRDPRGHSQNSECGLHR